MDGRIESERWRRGGRWRENEREEEKDGGVRQCREFDSSNCQRRCIIDVLRIPHCC